jgi:hypothetical protein
MAALAGDSLPIGRCDAPDFTDDRDPTPNFVT